MLVTKELNDDFRGGGLGSVVGSTHDCSNTIFIGSSIFQNIDTPNSLISNYKRTGNNSSISRFIWK